PRGELPADHERGPTAPRRECGTNRDLALLGGLRPDRDAASGTEMLLDRSVQIEPAERHRVARDDAPHRDDGHLRTSPADVDDQVPDRLVDRQTGTDR